MHRRRPTRTGSKSTSATTSLQVFKNDKVYLEDTVAIGTSTRPPPSAASTSGSCCGPLIRTPSTGRTRTACRATPRRSRPSPAATPRWASTATTTRPCSGRTSARLHPHGQRQDHTAHLDPPARHAGRGASVSRGRPALRPLRRFALLTVTSIAALGAFGVLATDRRGRELRSPSARRQGADQGVPRRAEPYGLRIYPRAAAERVHVQAGSRRHPPRALRRAEVAAVLDRRLREELREAHSRVRAVGVQPLDGTPDASTSAKSRSTTRARRRRPSPRSSSLAARSTASANWKKASLTELLAAAPVDRRRSTDYYVYFNADTRADPGFMRAADAADYPTQPQFGY